MCQHAIWKQSCYLLSVLITVITGNSADESLCCFLPLSPRLTRCSGELFPGPGASLNHLSCSALLCIALTARAADCSITLSQSDYICFQNEGLSARKICQTLLHFVISQNALCMSELSKNWCCVYRTRPLVSSCSRQVNVMCICFYDNSHRLPVRHVFLDLFF